MFPGKTLPAIPKPAFEPPMKVEVPCEKLTAQWNLGAWHLARHAVKNDKGQLRFNDHPYGILASETYLVLHALDLMGMHKEAADGLDQWLASARLAGTSKPVGLFSDGDGCLTHAVGPPGAGGNMDGIHGMGPGAIMLALVEHFRLTGDGEWLRANAPRMKANVEWILRQRRLLAGVVPGGDRLWCKGLQPAQQVTPDSGGQLMQFYESEAYYWLAVQRFARILAADRSGRRRAIGGRGGGLSPGPEGRGGTLHRAESRGAGARRDLSVVHSLCLLRSRVRVRRVELAAAGQRRPRRRIVLGHDPIGRAAGEPRGAAPARRPARARARSTSWKTGCCWRTRRLPQRTPGYDPEKHWFAHAAWQYQPGLERHANIHLAADDAPNFLRSWLNQYAVLILPDEGYTFPRAHDRRPARQDLRGGRVPRTLPQHAGHGGGRLLVAGAGDAAGMAGARQEDRGAGRPDALRHGGLPDRLRRGPRQDHGHRRDALPRRAEGRAAAVPPSPGRTDPARDGQRPGLGAVRQGQRGHPPGGPHRHGRRRGGVLRHWSFLVQEEPASGSSLEIGRLPEATNQT